MHRALLLISLMLVPGIASAQATTTVSSATLTVGSDAVLDLSGGTLDFGTTGTLDETGDGRVTGGLLTATRDLDAPAAVDVGGLGAVITAAIDLGSTTVTRGHTPPTNGTNTGIARYYDVSPANNAGLGATLVFHYHEDELNGLDEASLVLFRSNDGGTTWEELGGNLDPGANTITRDDVDTFAQFNAASSGAPLPVELTSFEATRDGADVLLRWQTASETNNAGFEVQHASAGAAHEPSLMVWQPVAFVAGRGTTTETQTYTHRTTGLVPGAYRFRLKQIDHDGAAEYSPEVEVAVGTLGAYHLTGAYPNPFNHGTHLSLSVAAGQHVAVTVYDALGRRVKVLFEGRIEAGRVQALTFEAADVPSGVYLIRAHGESFTATQQVTLLR